MMFNAIRGVSLALGCFLGGLGVGYTIVVKATPPPGAEESSEPESSSSQAVNEIEGSQAVVSANALAVGDQALVEGDIARALRHYRAATTDEADAEEIAYRIAVCLEGLGDLDAASSKYRALINNATNKNVVAAATLGIARSWHALDRPALAQNALWNFQLQKANSAGHPAIDAESSHLLAMLLALDASAQRKEPISHPIGIVFPKLSKSPWEAFDLLRRFGKIESVALQQPEPAGTSTVQVSQRMGDDALAISLRGYQPPANFPTALQHLATICDTKMQSSPRAHEQIRKRIVSFDVDDVGLAIVLDGLCHAHGVVWHQDGQVIKINAAAEVRPDQLEDYRFSVAKRALNRALMMFPAHGSADEALCLLGNLAFLQADFGQASEQYLRATSQYPKSDSRALIHFNHAKARMNAGDTQHAVDQLYHVVDLAVDSPVTSIAYLHIGRHYLSEGEPRSATKPFTRAISLAKTKQHKAAAVVDLACAYVMLNNPAGLQVLDENRETIDTPATIDKAALLSAFSRLKNDPDKDNLENNQRVLLTAVTHLSSAEVMQPYWGLITGRAYRELQLPDAARDALQEGLPERWSPLKKQMLQELGEIYEALGDLDAASKCYVSMAEGSSENQVEVASRLARIAYEAERHGECIDICLTNLKSSSESQRRTLFRLMGLAYQKLGKYEHAANCFLGKLPPDLATAVDAAEPAGTVSPTNL